MNSSYHSKNAYTSVCTSRFAHTKARELSDRNYRSYVHRKLRDGNDIRLVYLLPRRCWPTIGGHPVIRCELMTFPVGKAPPYAALSYAWGSPNLTRPLLIGTMLFDISENLAGALDHLANSDRTLVLWVDALCINQGDEAEKSHQVQRMGQIYQSAAIVFAWLGPSTKTTDVAMRALRAMPSMSESQRYSWIKAVSEDELAKTMPPEVMTSFINLPWFRRVWVTQEVVLNRRAYFLCGNQNLISTRLINGLTMVGAAAAKFSGPPMPTYIVRFVMKGPLPFSEYLQSSVTRCALSYGAYLETSEPKDFVYSQLGMIEDRDQVLRVDYSDSIEKIYTEFAEAIVRHCGIEPLARYWRPSHRYKKLPSWVPDWSATVRHHSPEAESSRPVGAPKPEIRRREHGARVLLICAGRVDQIERVLFDTHEFHNNAPGHEDSALFWTKEKITTFLDTLREAISLRSSSPSKAPSLTARKMGKGSHLSRREPANIYEGEDSVEDKDPVKHEDSVCGKDKVFALSISMLVAQNPHIPNLEALYASYLAFQRLSSPNDETASTEADVAASQLYREALQSSRVRQVFVTRAGFVGLSKDEVLKGDALFFFSEGSHFWATRGVGKSRTDLKLVSYISFLGDELGEMLGIMNYEYTCIW